jgi:hypothetical protein
MTARPVGLSLTLFLTLSSAAPLTPQEEKDSYEIYAAVLQAKEPKVKVWTIVQQTRDFALCLNSAADQEFIYRPMFDDYATKNKQSFLLGRKFNLPDYTLVPPEEWNSKPPRRSFAVFSAVGFNSDRTRAAVCFWSLTSGTCSLLIKNGDVWLIDKAWRGDACFWAA